MKLVLNDIEPWTLQQIRTVDLVMEIYEDLGTKTWHKDYIWSAGRYRWHC